MAVYVLNRLQAGSYMTNHPTKKPASLRRPARECYGGGTSDGGVAVLVGADADDILQREHEDLAVADLAGLGGAGDSGDHLGDDVVGHGDLDLHLGQEVHGVFAAAVDLGVAFLAA